ncbi:hypothetical protein ABRQ22_15460 [Cellulosimicrobium sp. ES-005]|uniref:Uncharacterized protein n=1 Tax=Cellulosimicrobium sp. ES-005 TaxID=3163031 RepID=A0AAU8FYU0_9MICO
MTTTHRTTALLTHHLGLPTPDEQEATIRDAGISVDEHTTIAPLTDEDWADAVASIAAGLGPGDTLAVARLVALGATPRLLLDALEEVLERGAHLACAHERIDTRTAPAAAHALTALAHAIEEGRDVRTRAFLATPTLHGVTPPHARFVPLDSYERTTA